jgi:hypothetical protein
MEKITILKTVRGADTLHTEELAAVAERIRREECKEVVNGLRADYPLLDIRRQEDGSMTGAWGYLQRLPRLCFASEMLNRDHRRLRIAYTGLVLLEVNNLTGYEEAAAIRRGSSLMPQTLLAFVGASGRSVKMVCRGELAGERQDGDAALPVGDDDVRRFHVALYEKARMAYNAQLGVTVEKLEPGLERTCYMSSDAEAVCNSSALPFYIDMKEDVRQAAGVVRTSNIEPEETVPGLGRYVNLQHIYEFNLTKAYDSLPTDVKGEERMHQLLQLLADGCQETGIPQGVALRLTEYRAPFRSDRELVRLVFANAYREESQTKYHQRKRQVKPLKNVPPETLLTMKIDMFLRENYELRLNVMRGVAEYRQRTGLGFDFEDLTEQARNSITMRALEQGIKCWDKDIRRYVNSNDIEQYDPILDFLDHLPRWDGRDRATPLALRVHTAYKEWPHLFRIWMRSMVAMWQGKGQLTGNALVPLLIGRQGCGKSSFCRILLPRQQREYYNDRINFKNESDLNLGLTSFALINLDEFDKITQRQQIVLKYLVSTAELKYRPPYGKAYSSHRRYASFVGTTNEPMPLTDPSGSRRFICVQVAADIDFKTPVDYPQLYAQLKQEIADGGRYWLTKDEEAALMEHNRQYQRLSGLGEMLLSLYRKPDDGLAGQPSGSDGAAKEGQWLSLKRIAARMKQAFGSGFKEEPGTLEKLGAFMNRTEYKFDSRRKSSGMEYYVAERE